ncbi:MAG: glycosyltransferase family 2 protein [Planctomycetota bacterium]
MNATCLINSHNYRAFVGEAIQSALDQTKPFDEVIVVDDGSTDGSQQYLRDTYGNDSRVKILCKSQNGQLSCFNRGIAYVSTDLVFFLDADDRYRPDYLEKAERLYANRSEVDFLSVAPHHFGSSSTSGKRRMRPTRDWGISVLGALFGNHWIGECTSCLSMRTATARAVLPYPREEDWITRADDVLVFGSSIVGAFKHHLEEPLVEYRIHGQNAFAGHRFDATAKMRRSLAINRLANWYAQESGFELDLLPRWLHREFRTRQLPTFREWLDYLQLSLRARLPLSIRCQHLASMMSHYFTAGLLGDNAAKRDVSPQPASLGQQLAATDADAA